MDRQTLDGMSVAGGSVARISRPRCLLVAHRSEPRGSTASLGRIRDDGGPIVFAELHVGPAQ